MNNSFHNVDRICLGEGVEFVTDSAKTGLNNNVAIIGSTGSRKTYGCVIPTMLQTNNASVVTTVTKRKLVNILAPSFKEKGYDVQVIDFVNPEKSTIGYDPFKYMNDEYDVTSFANNVFDCSYKNHASNESPYWSDSAKKMCKSLAWLAKHNQKDKSGTMKDFLKMAERLDMVSDKGRGDHGYTNMAEILEAANEKWPNNYASLQWKGFEGLSTVTLGCVLSTFHTAIADLLQHNVKETVSKSQIIDFSALGEKKTALFIITDSSNRGMDMLVNLLYADLFNVLLKKAEATEEGALAVPVRVICDDFATGTKLPGFAEKISIFRAAGISAMLLLQSEDQLKTMYGEHEASTILDNCDTLVFTGSNNLNTAKTMASRVNKTVQTILALPYDENIICRRGTAPIFCKKYDVFANEDYQEAVRLSESAPQMAA